MLAQILIPVVVILLILVALNSPIWVAIFGATLYLQIFVNHMNLTNLFTGIFEACTKTSLLAVPYFILAGSIIASSSLGTRLINIFIALLRNIRGGLAIACLVANAIFGAISGSAPAATATFGKVVYEPLKEAHGKKLSLGLITSSGALSTVIPPSITLIIFGVATETSISRLFICGFLPGIVLVAIVAVYLFIVCKENAFATSTVSDNCEDDIQNLTIKKAFKEGILVLLLPVIVLGGIYSGLCTPTESGAIAALYSFIVAFFVYKDLKPSNLMGIFKDSAKTTAQIFILIAVSTAFAQAATIAQLPLMIQGMFSGVGKIGFLLILNIVLLIVGCFFDSSAAILIFAPMLLGTAVSLGISPLQLGIIFTVNLSIGMFTPPFGLNIFVSQSVLKVSMSDVAKSVLPFIGLYVLGLFLITYIPQISLILPQLLGQ
ncbi:TRAP transporter large permease [Eubacterium ramulus]